VEIRRLEFEKYSTIVRRVRTNILASNHPRLSGIGPSHNVAPERNVDMAADAFGKKKLRPKIPTLLSKTCIEADYIIEQSSSKTEPDKL
jgi:ribosomal protein L33